MMDQLKRHSLKQLVKGFFKSEEYNITVHSARLCDLLIYLFRDILMLMLDAMS